MRRVLYIISDLHLGGDPSEDGVPGDRGFQICRQGELAASFVRALARKQVGNIELVINGDIVDFLAEHALEGGWRPFHRDPGEACRILDVLIKEREPDFFSSLREFVRIGHRLTLILGNHDLELSLPAVRQAIREFLEVDRGQLRFVYDNEAYVVGKAIIEHGNRADSMNEVDHDALRHVRVLQSRQADSATTAPFKPPVGSRLVAELMNPLKVRFPFIDLLKPEAEGMIPILIALEPSVLRDLPRLLVFGAKGLAKAAMNRVAPRYGDAISSEGTIETVSDLLKRTLGDQEAAALLALVERHDGHGGNISFSPTPPWRAAVALRLLRKLIRQDRTFDLAGEISGQYREAAVEHISNGFQAVVFGHTHRACREDLIAANGARGIYLNSGTWIDLIQVPSALLEAGNEVTETMEHFLEDLKAGRLEDWILNRPPTYVRLEIKESGEVEEAVLCFYREEDPDSIENQTPG